MPLLCRNDYVADVCGGLHLTESANVIKLAALRIESAAGIRIIRAQLLEHLRHRDPAARTADRDPAAPDTAWSCRPVPNRRRRRDGAVTAFQHPRLQRLQLLRRVVRAHQDIAVNQSARTEQRRNPGRNAVGKRRVRHTLKCLLAREIRIGLVFEIHLQRRQAVERNRAQRLNLRDAVHLHFQRNGDQPLHFLRRMAGPLRDDFDVRRRQVGIGVDREVSETRPRPRRSTRAPP